MDSATDLQTSGISRQRLPRCQIISRTELDHMPAAQPVIPESLREPPRRSVRHEILGRPRAVIAQTAADDLFYLALVEVDARAEFCHGNHSCAHSCHCGIHRKRDSSKVVVDFSPQENEERTEVLTDFFPVFSRSTSTKKRVHDSQMEEPRRAGKFDRQEIHT
jgi:hypothetical protein